MSDREVRERAARKLADLLAAANDQFEGNHAGAAWRQTMEGWLGGDIGYWAGVVSHPAVGLALVDLLRHGGGSVHLTCLANAVLDGETAGDATASARLHREKTPALGTHRGDIGVGHGLYYVHRDNRTVSKLDAENLPAFRRPELDMARALVEYASERLEEQVR